MSVKLRKRKLASGNVSLYLDIYQSGKRASEFLGLYFTKDKTASKETLKLAENIQAKRQVKFSTQNTALFRNSRKKLILFGYRDFFGLLTKS